MKNKGRRQLAGNGNFNGIANCKSELVVLTRPIEQISSRPDVNGVGASKKFMKKKWSKRVRGYFKSQTKNIFGNQIDE